jgi:membrane protein
LNLLIEVLKFFKKLFMIIFRSIKKFFNDQGFIIANGLSFKTIFAMIPVIAVFFAFFSVFPSFNEYKEKFLKIVIQYIVPALADDAQLWIDKVLLNIKTIGAIGTIGLIYISIDLFITLDIQINYIWGARAKRSLIHRILIYWAFITITPIVLVAFFYYSGIIPSMLDSLSSITNFKEIFYSVLSFLLMESFFFFLYYFIPNTKVSLVKALIVSGLVSLTWTILRFVFTYYSRMIIHNWSFYGSIAAVLFFLFWIYINWLVLFMGIEFLYIWQNKLYFKDYKIKKYYLFDLCFVILILKEFYKDFKVSGNGLSVSDIAGKIKYDYKEAEEIIFILEKEDFLIAKDDIPRIYFLRKDLSKISLTDTEKIVINKMYYKEILNSVNFKEVYEKIEGYYFNKKENISINKIFD